MSCTARKETDREHIKTDLRFEDQGDGLTRFVQEFDFGEPLEVEADGFEEEYRMEIATDRVI
jgi:hypothetical protein